MKQQQLRFILCLLFISSIHLETQAQIFVDIDNISGTENGNSWATAYTDLQPALDAATAGDEIWVAAGTYLPTVEFDADGGGGSDVREKTFYIKTDGIKIYGGFDGTETVRTDRDIATNATILSGDIGTPADDTDNSYHVVFMDGTTASGTITTATVLDGFTVQDGKADSGAFINKRGGGLFNNGYGNGKECSPTLTNCTFTNNSASSNGGGIYNNGSQGTSSPTLTNCTFTSNSATTSGGVMYNSGSFSGTSSPTLTNCTFTSNSASDDGEVMYNAANSGTSSPTLTNCILWSNGGTAIFNNIATGTTFNYGVYDDGTIDGTANLPTGVSGSNNLEADPLFVDAANNDVRLLAGSPALDAGDNAAWAATGLSTDLGGDPRPQNTTVDIGAYEGVACLFTTAIYVNHAATGNNEGTSWADAYTDLQDAIDNWCGNAEIWVAAGTYLPTKDNTGNASPTNARTKTFYIKTDGIKLYGGFDGSETVRTDRDIATNATILSGDIGTPADNTDNSYHVVFMDGTTASGTITTATVLDGFIVQDGKADGSASTNKKGGGLYQGKRIKVMLEEFFLNNPY